MQGARTPSEVITAGRGGVWNDLLALRQSYDELRAAQVFIMGAEVSHQASHYLYDDAHASRLYIRNIDEILPGWKTPDTRTVTLSGTPPDPRPWPTDAVEQLVWLSASDAQVWLPTRHDLATLQAELHRQHNPAPEVIPGRPDRTQKKPTPATVF